MIKIEIGTVAELWTAETVPPDTLVVDADGTLGVFTGDGEWVSFTSDGVAVTSDTDDLRLRPVVGASVVITSPIPE
jgi:hypothetical protein